MLRTLAEHATTFSGNLVSCNYYGGDNVKDRLGWFGPTEANGYWNPWYPENRKP